MKTPGKASSSTVPRSPNWDVQTPQNGKNASSDKCDSKKLKQEAAEVTAALIATAVAAALANVDTISIQCKLSVSMAI